MSILEEHPKVHLLVSRTRTKLACVWLVDPIQSRECVREEDTLKNDIMLLSPLVIPKHA